MNTQKRPKFSKQHYVMIADVLVDSITRSEVIDNLCTMFSLDNSNFNDDKFREASQME